MRGPELREHLTALVYCLDRSGDSALATGPAGTCSARVSKSTHLRLILGVLLVRIGKLERAGAIFPRRGGHEPEELGRAREPGPDHRAAWAQGLRQKFYARAAR